ncbi:hypothetical protein HKCCE4037_06410 [Rhodobacterales bacterium HKCCE4037]|nr:hypothetical protein [Rhodobacterales bacterium HKCCE4037]
MASTEMALVTRIEASIARFERNMAKARQTGRSTAQGIQSDFDRVNQRLGQSSAQAASSFSRILNISGSGRFVLQNTANQIGDIAVQLQGGTSASRAFGQQLPQLFGGLGALGGVLGVVGPLLGTIAALGLPAAAAFFAIGGNAESAADRIEAAADALEEVGRRTEGLRAGQTAIRDLEVQLAGAILLRGANQEAVSEASIRAMTAEIEARRAMIRLEQFQTQEAIRAARERVAALQAEADEVLAAAQNYIAAQEANIANDPFRSEAEIAAMRSRMTEGLFEYLDGHQEVFLQLQAQTAELEAQEAVLAAGNTLLGDSADLSAELTATLASGNMDQLTADAEALAERLGINIALAQELLSTFNSMPVASSGLQGGRSAGRGGPTAEELRRNVPAVQLAYTYGSAAPRTRARSGGGGGGGGPEIAEMTAAMRMAAQVIREVREEEVTLADVQAALNEQMQTGEINAEQYAAAMELAAERFDSANGELRTMGDLLAQMAVNWENAGDIAVNALRRIAQQLLSQAFTTGLQRLAGGPGGNVLTTIAGGLFGGSFEGGGHTGMGPRVGGVDGRGGRLAVVHPNEQIHDIHAMQGVSMPSMPRMGRGGAVVTDRRPIVLENHGPAMEMTSAPGDDRVAERFVLNTVAQGGQRGQLRGAGLRPSPFQR